MKLLRILLPLLFAGLLCSPVGAQQAYFPGGVAKIHCATKTTISGDTPCPDGSSSAPSFQYQVPIAIVPTDRGGTITLGGTSQTLAAANSSRRCLIIVNPISATEQGIATAENMYINNNAVAAVAGAGANFAPLAPGGSVTFCFNGFVDQTAITVNATTTGHRWNAKEYN